MSEPPISTSARLPRTPTVLAGQLAYQVRLLSRTPRAVVMIFVFPILLLLVRHTADANMPAAVRASAVGGVLAFSVIATAFQTHTAGLIAARERGVLKRLRGTPLPPWCYFAGRIGATCTLALVGAATALATSVFLGAPAPAAGAVLGVAAVVVLAALAWAAAGTAITAWIGSNETAAPMLTVVMLPLMFFSGLFFPTSDEPSWLATIAGWLPAEPLVDGVAHALAAGLTAVPTRDVLVLAAWGVAGLAVSVRYFRWEQARPSSRRARTDRPEEAAL